jgi:hypothetical protein
MDMKVQLFRTLKGQEEIFNQGHTVRPKCRQILFSIGNGISFGELRDKLSSTEELETLVENLLQGGYIETKSDAATAQPAAAAAPAAAPAIQAAPEAPVSAAPPAAPVAPPAASPVSGGLEAARNYVLEFMGALAGTKSPAYRKMSEVQDEAGFKDSLQMCRKVVAAVASPHQATEMETQAIQHLGG